MKAEMSIKIITQIEEKKLFFVNAACASIQAEALSWANANRERIVTSRDESDAVILFGCQVTDLAILNDIRYLRACNWHKKHKVYFSGCAAKRFDVPFENICKGVNIERLEMPYVNYSVHFDESLVYWLPPFWTNNFDPKKADHTDGHRFRHDYLLRIGRSCKHKCKYCTIPKMRGRYEALDDYPVLASELQFAHNRGQTAILISESPETKQLIKWADISLTKNIPIKLRNVEPHVVVACFDVLTALAESGLLPILHAPIQSGRDDILTDMGRNPHPTRIFIEGITPQLQSLGTRVCTNIIIDYKDYREDLGNIYKLFDSVSWNPYWNGVWDYETAKGRWNKYFGTGRVRLVDAEGE